jgi:hypothetical protein
VGIGLGTTSVGAGGLLGIEWLLGRLYAKKTDLKQMRAAARQAGIKDERDYWEFSDWLHGEKDRLGLPPDYHTSFKELVEWAKEWIELYGEGN